MLVYIPTAFYNSMSNLIWGRDQLPMAHSAYMAVLMLGVTMTNSVKTFVFSLFSFLWILGLRVITETNKVHRICKEKG